MSNVTDVVGKFEEYLKTVESVRPYYGAIDDLEVVVKRCRSLVDAGADSSDDELFILCAWDLWRELREEVARLVATYG